MFSWFKKERKEAREQFEKNFMQQKLDNTTSFVRALNHDDLMNKCDRLKAMFLKERIRANKLEKSLAKYKRLNKLKREEIKVLKEELGRDE
jgi:hypothetical protein